MVALRAAVLSQFRAAVGRVPEDPRFVELVAALAEASPEFRDRRRRAPRRGARRPGRLPAAAVEYPDLLVVLQVPATEEDLARVQSLQ